MRRYSKKHSLVTLSDINITPMLDLAFVLLIIFVISTPLLEQGMNLDLPEGGDTDTQQPEVKKTIEISPAGRYELDGEQMTLVAIEQALVQAHRALDRAVDKAYRGRKFDSESERVAFLFDRYEALSNPLGVASSS